MALIRLLIKEGLIFLLLSLIRALIKDTPFS
jgi:hypothetical protein